MSRGRPNSLMAQSLPTLLEHTAALDDLRDTRVPVEYIDVHRLLPARDQARLSFRGQTELVASVLADGVRTPLIVRPHPEHPGSYEIVAGERRWRAATEAAAVNPERGAVPCQIRHLTDDQAFLVGGRDNLEREDLNAYERARLIMNLLERRSELTQDELRVRLARASRSDAAQRDDERDLRGLFASCMTELRLDLTLQSFGRYYLPLLTLPEDLLAALQSGVSYKAVLKLRFVGDPETRQAIIGELQRGILSYEALDARIKAQRAPREASTLGRRLQALSARRVQSRVAKLDAERRAQVEALTAQLEALLLR